MDDWQYIRSTGIEPYTEEEQQEALERLRTSKIAYATALFSQPAGVEVLKEDLEEYKSKCEKGKRPPCKFLAYHMGQQPEAVIGWLEKIIAGNFSVIERHNFAAQYLDHTQEKAPAPEQKQMYWAEAFELALRNMRLVSVARKYPILEQQQQGFLGLLEAIDRYDPDKGAFATYAVGWIRQSIRRGNGAIWVKGMRLPSHAIDMYKGLRKLSEDGAAPEDLYQYCRDLNLEAKTTRALIHLCNAGLFFLDEEYRENGRDVHLPLASLIANISDTLYAVTEKERLEKIRQAIGTAMTGLSQRERTIIKHRFEDGWTLQKVGDELGLTRERVRQIEAEVLLRLRFDPLLRQLHFGTSRSRAVGDSGLNAVERF